MSVEFARLDFNFDGTHNGIPNCMVGISVGFCHSKKRQIRKPDTQIAMITGDVR